MAVVSKSQVSTRTHTIKQTKCITLLKSHRGQKVKHHAIECV